MAESFFKKIMTPTTEGMLLTKLTCPKCKDPICPPIYHCDKGHSFCNLCYKSGYDCTFCGSKCSGGRTHHLERIVELYTYPCKYSNKGCRKRCKIQKLRTHEEYCQTFEIKCPFTLETTCSNVGNRQQTVFHCQLVHTERTFIGNGSYKFRITDSFLNSIAEIQKKIRNLNRKKTFISIYMLYVDEIIYRVVCQFELEHVKVAMYRISSPSEIDDKYEFVFVFHNDNHTPVVVIRNECATVGEKPRDPLFDDVCVNVDVEILKSCQFCLVQIVEK